MRLLVPLHFDPIKSLRCEPLTTLPGVAHGVCANVWRPETWGCLLPTDRGGARQQPQWLAGSGLQRAVRRVDLQNVHVHGHGYESVAYKRSAMSTAQTSPAAPTLQAFNTPCPPPSVPHSRPSPRRPPPSPRDRLPSTLPRPTPDSGWLALLPDRPPALSHCRHHTPRPSITQSMPIKIYNYTSGTPSLYSKLRDPRLPPCPAAACD